MVPWTLWTTRRLQMKIWLPLPRGWTFQQDNDPKRVQTYTKMRQWPQNQALHMAVPQMIPGHVKFFSTTVTGYRDNHALWCSIVLNPRHLAIIFTFFGQIFSCYVVRVRWLVYRWVCPALVANYINKSKLNWWTGQNVYKQLCHKIKDNGAASITRCCGNVRENRSGKNQTFMWSLQIFAGGEDVNKWKVQMEQKTANSSVRCLALLEALDAKLTANYSLIMFLPPHLTWFEL